MILSTVLQRGYRAGIEYVDSDADVAIQYVGGDNPFGDTTTAKEIATTQKGKGYDIIFHAAGGSGLGVFAWLRNLISLQSVQTQIRIS